MPRILRYAEQALSHFKNPSYRKGEILICERIQWVLK